MRKKRKTNKEKGDAFVSVKKNKAKSANVPDYSDDESEIGSEVTHLSLDDDSQSVTDEGCMEDTEITEGNDTMLRDKIAEHLDNSLHKKCAILEYHSALCHFSLSIRLAALKNLQLLLTRYVMPEIIEKWKLTLMDVVEKALKKGGKEATIGVSLIALFALQLVLPRCIFGLDGSDVVAKVLDQVMVHCSDTTLDSDYRADCSTSLALGGYLCVDELESRLRALSCLRSAWVGIKSGNTPAEHVHLFCVSVAAWALLLEQMNARRIDESLNCDLPKLCLYLDSTQVEVRIATGECLAHLYELGVDVHKDPDYRPANHQQSLNLLAQLATDSLKYRAKRERRVQRCSFRQIYTAIKDKSPPALRVKFCSETVQLESWSSKLIYDIACRSLHGGMNCHLQKNQLLRQIFQLGAPLTFEAQRISKSQRMSIQNAVSKARMMHRGKQRDKRLASNSET